MEFVRHPIEKEFISKCFSEDDNFVKNIYVIDIKTVDACVDDIVEKLQERDDTDNQAEFYFIIDNNVNVGFFAINYYNNIKFLRTFFIRPKYRKYKNEFLDKLKSEGSFLSTIYNSNKKAINYFINNDGIIIGIIEVKDNLKGLIFKF